MLEMHGASLLKCITSLCRLKADGETFGARATSVRAYLDHLLKGCTSMESTQERMTMWFTLSSYSQECMATVLKDHPEDMRDLAQAVCRFEEVHSQGTKYSQYTQQRPPFHHRFQGSGYSGLHQSQGRDDHLNSSQPRSKPNPPPPQHQQNHPPQPPPPPQQQQQAYRQPPWRQRQQGPGYDDRAFQPLCFICQEPGHKAATCPNKGKGYANKLYSTKPIRRLGRTRPGSKKVPNIVEGSVNGYQTTFILDTGADITVVNKNLVRGDQLTGELVSLEGIGGTEFTYPTAVVQVQAGNITIPIIAAI